MKISPWELCDWCVFHAFTSLCIIYSTSTRWVGAGAYHRVMEPPMSTWANTWETPQPCFHFPTTIIYQLEMSNLLEKKYVLNQVKLKSWSFKKYIVNIVGTHQTNNTQKCSLPAWSSLIFEDCPFYSCWGFIFFLCPLYSLVQIYILPSVLSFSSDPPHQALIHHFNSHHYLTPSARWRHPNGWQRKISSFLLF